LRFSSLSVRYSIHAARMSGSPRETGAPMRVPPAVATYQALFPQPLVSELPLTADHHAYSALLLPGA
jgi:hypothetical protein